MKKKVLITAAILVFALCCAGLGAWAASNFGTQSDPLVAMSYLEDVLQPQLEREFDAALDSAVESVSSAAGEFVSVGIGSGVSLAKGAELLCLEGGVTCTGALIDLTGGGVLNAGEALEANHLYLSAAEGSVLSGSGEALVRGSYTAG